MADTSTQEATIIVIRGIPGSGKSYVAKHLEKALEDRGVTLLDPDSVDATQPEFIELSEKLTGEGLAKEIHPFRWLRQQAVESARGGSIIIWNQPFTKLDILNRLIQFIAAGAKKNGVGLRVLILEVNTPKDIAYSRITDRINAGGHGPSQDTFNNRVDSYSSFADSAYNTLQLDGQSDIDSILEEVKSLLT